MAIPVDLSVGASIAPIEVGADDTLYYRFVSEGASAPSTAVLKAFSMLTESDPGDDEGALTIDGTKANITVSGFKYIRFAVTNTESAKRGTLHIFARKTQE